MPCSARFVRGGSEESLHVSNKRDSSLRMTNVRSLLGFLQEIGQTLDNVRACVHGEDRYNASEVAAQDTFSLAELEHIRFSLLLSPATL